MCDKLKILIVEDDAPMAEMLEKLVKPLIEYFPGSSVILVQRMADALEIIGSMAKPDVVLLDLSLPDSGMAQTLSRIDEIDSQCPVVIVTGHATESVEKALAGRVFDIVHKSPELFRSNVLVRAIIATINRWQENRWGKIADNLARMRAIVNGDTP